MQNTSYDKVPRILAVKLPPRGSRHGTDDLSSFIALRNRPNPSIRWEARDHRALQWVLIEF